MKKREAAITKALNTLGYKFYNLTDKGSLWKKDGIIYHLDRNVESYCKIDEIHLHLDVT